MTSRDLNDRGAAPAATLSIVPPRRRSLAEDAEASGAEVGVCEIEIDGIESDLAFAAARWDLFAFPAVLYVLRIGTINHALIVYRGDRPEIDRWIGAVPGARFLSQPDGPRALHVEEEPPGRPEHPSG